MKIFIIKHVKVQRSKDFIKKKKADNKTTANFL